jgi:hypothetical protein
VISILCELAGRATFCRPRGTLWSMLVYRTEISFGHWRASGVAGHNCGCQVDDPLSLQHSPWWVVPCLVVLQTADRREVGVLVQTLG